MSHQPSGKRGRAVRRSTPSEQDVPSHRVIGSVLVIGYGNTLRGDDAAGIRAAEELGRRCPERLTVLTSHGLLPELAVDIARADAVVFIDASSTTNSVAIRPVVPQMASQRHVSPHGSEPAALLGLCRSLYGRAPTESLLVEIPAHSLELGEQLSDETSRGVEEAVSLVLARLQCL